MTNERPRWAWLLFPHLSIIVAASILAACHRLPVDFLSGGPDKVGHLLLFGGLSLFAVAFFGRSRWLAVVGVLGALAACEEASQALFPARTVDGGDLAANLIGIALGACVAVRLTRVTEVTASRR